MTGLVGSFFFDRTDVSHIDEENRGYGWGCSNWFHHLVCSTSLLIMGLWTNDRDCYHQ